MGKAERTRQFIIEKAAPLFNVKGIAGTSIQDIMEATKLAKGGIYGNFATKDQISLETFEYMLEVVKQAIRSAVANESTYKGKLLAILEFYKNYPIHPPIAGGCPIINFSVEADDTHPLLKKKLNETINYFQSSITKLIHRGIENKEFSKDWDAEIFAVKMFAMIDGAILISRIQDNNKQMKIIIEILKQELDTYSL